MCFTSNMTFVVGNCRYLTFCAAADSYLKKKKKP